VQDETQGIYVRVAYPQATLPAGKRVEVEGVTGPGQFAPIVDRPRITTLGWARLPVPRRVSLEQLLTGAADSQWIEVEGLVVRRVEAERLLLAAGDYRFPAWVPIAEMQPPPLHLLNARVRVRGVSNVFFNRQRQVAGIGLNVPTLRQVTVTEAAPDPAAMSVSPISSLLRFSPDGSAGRLVRVQGTVVLTRGGHTLFIQDDTGAAQVQAAAPPSVGPGDRVDVVGFPGAGGLSPLLHDAMVRGVGRGRIPEPVPITAAEAMRGAHDLERVEMEARLLDESPTGRDAVLTLQSGQVVFTAHLEEAAPLRLRHGSLLRLAGVCSVQVDETRAVRGFRLLVRSAEDVGVLRSPPWLRLEHVALAAVLLVIAGLAVHRVRLLQVEASFKAVAEERARMAREIHDTLQQHFVGVLVQLELKNPDQARVLVRSGMAEARRLVQNLRAPALDAGDLPRALASVVRQLDSATGARIELTVSGAPRRLPDMTENSLLRIGQEALLNAIKHGRAGRIRVDLAFTSGAVRLSVHDDGCGFDSAQAPLSGHFGLLGMHERTEQLGGELQIRSRPGEGTDIRVAVRLES
jgi:signal transduction histidine kinase